MHEKAALTTIFLETFHREHTCSPLPLIKLAEKTLFRLALYLASLIASSLISIPTEALTNGAAKIDIVPARSLRKT